MAKAKSALKRAAPKKRARKAAAGSRGLDPRHCLVEDADFEKETKERIEREGGQVLAAYREPLGKNALILAVPPLEEVLKTMRERAGKFNADKIKQEDLASAGGSADYDD